MTPREALVERARREEWPSARPEPKRYPHSVLCSANRYRPLGHPGCPCLRWLKDIDHVY